jgi:hypothetical protein
MSKSDRALGMQRQISRRDFVHDTSRAAPGLMAIAGCGNETADDTAPLAGAD